MNTHPEIDDMAASPRRTNGLPEQVPTQDLSHELVCEWMDSACLDAVIDEDGDVLISVEGTRVFVRVDDKRGIVLVHCPINLPDDLEVDRLELLEAVNRVNRSTLYVRAVLRGGDGDPWVRYEHELFGVDAFVGRRQLVKLVRAVKEAARARHRQLHGMVA